MKKGSGKMTVIHCDKCGNSCNLQALSIFDRTRDIRWDICRVCFELLEQGLFVANPKGERIVRQQTFHGNLKGK